MFRKLALLSMTTAVAVFTTAAPALAGSQWG